MLYKVTPMMSPPVSKDTKAREAGQPRKRRKSAIFDAEGQEVLISLMCIKCRSLKPLAQFGLRKMADGAIRNQPWCRTCRSGAGKPKEKAGEPANAVGGLSNVASLVQVPAVAATLQVVPAPAPARDEEPIRAVASQG